MWIKIERKKQPFIFKNNNTGGFGKKDCNCEPVKAYFFSPECVDCLEMTPRLTPLTAENDIEIVKYNVLEYGNSWNAYI